MGIDRKTTEVIEQASKPVASLFQALLAGLLLIVIPLHLHAASTGSLDEGVALYEKGFYDEALVQFASTPPSQRSEGRFNRYFALTYYHLKQYDQALPLLAAAHAYYPGNRDVKIAYAEALLAMGEGDQALAVIGDLRPFHTRPSVALLAARIHAKNGDIGRAISLVEKALPRAGARKVQLQRYLVQLHGDAGQPRNARTVIDTMVEDSSYTFLGREALAMQKYFPDADKGQLDITLIYRFEDDSNIRLAPSTGPVGFGDKSDTRHVIIADVVYQMPLKNNWDLRTEAHLTNWENTHIDELDMTRLDLIVNPGWSGGRYGFQLPVGYTWTAFGHDRYQRAYRLSPGGYYRVSDNVYAYAHVRYEDHEFDLDVLPEEDYSGSRASGGASFFWGYQPGKGNLRVGFTTGHFDADGENWERDEVRVYALVSQKLTNRVSLALTLEHYEGDYDNTHTVFGVKRDDEIDQGTVMLSYTTKSDLELQARATHIEADSNIDLYNYDRDIIGAGVAWHF